MIVLDSREPAHVIRRVQDYCTRVGVPVLPAPGDKAPALPVGDALVIGQHLVLVVERKTSSDLYHSIKDGRWQSQARRLAAVWTQGHDGRPMAPLVIVYGWSPRHLDNGKLGEGKRVLGMQYTAYMNAQLSMALLGVPVLFGGSVRYPEYLHGLLKYANKKRHHILSDARHISLMAAMEDDDDDTDN